MGRKKIEAITCCGNEVTDYDTVALVSNTCPHCGRFNGHSPWKILLPSSEHRREDPSVSFARGGIAVHGPMGLDGMPMHDECGCAIIGFKLRWKNDGGGLEVPKDSLRFGWTLLPGYYTIEKLEFILSRNSYAKLREGYRIP